MSIKNKSNQNFLETIGPEIVHKIFINKMEFDLLMFRRIQNHKK